MASTNQVGDFTLLDESMYNTPLIMLYEVALLRQTGWQPCACVKIAGLQRAIYYKVTIQILGAASDTRYAYHIS
eukprot:108106-Amphidinium_carterae.1